MTYWANNVYAVREKARLSVLRGCCDTKCNSGHPMTSCLLFEPMWPDLQCSALTIKLMPGPPAQWLVLTILWGDVRLTYTVQSDIRDISIFCEPKQCSSVLIVNRFSCENSHWRIEAPLMEAHRGTTLCRFLVRKSRKCKRFGTQSQLDDLGVGCWFSTTSVINRHCHRAEQSFVTHFCCSKAAERAQ